VKEGGPSGQRRLSEQQLQRHTHTHSIRALGTASYVMSVKDEKARVLAVTVRLEDFLCHACHVRLSSSPLSFPGPVSHQGLSRGALWFSVTCRVQ
jgi:hypothetical protein